MLLSFKMSALESFISELRENKEFLRNVTRWETIPARSGEFGPFPDDLHPDIRRVLQKRGINNLYSHQAESYRNVRSGKNVVVVTPTASGKTLCYNLPVLQNLLENETHRALYIFPTKALSGDQQSELNEIILGGEIPVKVHTYDGDTPSSIRIAARDTGRIIISNPDMIHSGILPNHPRWIKFFSCLKYVVIDEVHIYRGVFGSHMTNVIRRLKRVAGFYGSDPRFICCSATIGNPQDLSEGIIEAKTVLIDNNGAPSGEKNIILYNPPLVDRVQGIRRGVVLESRNLALDFLKRNIKTIVFARSRTRTELIASYINNALKNFFNENRGIRVEAYRGGYLPSERKIIERGLREGKIQGVVSTNALELGIDIGDLDVSIIAGFPGSIASSWQQAGRAGRRKGISVSVMMASAAPTDQYMIGHPEYFFSRSPESGWIDPDNIYILIDHLKCAVFELPIKQGEPFGGDVGSFLDHLEETGVVRLSGGVYYWADHSYPAEQISLRSATSNNIVIIDTTAGGYSVIGEMDRPSAKELLFKHAVYIHRGEQYIVSELDVENQKCYVQREKLNYYTDSITKTDIQVLHEDKKEYSLGVHLVLGDVLVRAQVTKFKKIRYHSHESIGYGEILLPEEEMHTRSITILFSADTPGGKLFNALPQGVGEKVMAGFGTLVKNAAPVFLLCDRGDIGVAERVRDPHFSAPAMYIYDKYPGGIGLSEGLYEKADVIFHAGLDMVRRCPCSYGCPSCIGAEGNLKIGQGEDSSRPGANPKKALVDFLTQWLEAEHGGG